MTRLILGRSALETIRGLTDAHDAATETGGILLGYHNAQTIEITAAGDAGPHARHTSTSFTRDLVHAQRLAADAWVRDRSQWVGEWHTHPAGALAPSTIDLSTYLHLLAAPDLAFDTFVALIVQPRRRRLAAWVVTPSEATCVPCEVV